MNDSIKGTSVASVAELKARLSEFLRIAKAGGEVVVTDRGNPIARLVPVAPSLAGDARLSHLARAGLLRKPSRSLAPETLEQKGPADPDGRSLRIVLDEREGGW